MSGLAHLRSLAQGRRPADDGLLENTRCTWGESVLVSEEAILATFAAQPFGLEEPLHAVETAQGAALIGQDEGLFADIYDGRIGRLWRIGGTSHLPAEPAVDVAFDADMRQERGDLNFRAEDHPCLDQAAAERLVAALREMLDGMRGSGSLRVRGFVLRACGDQSACAALVALYTMSNEPSRSAAFRFVLLGLDANGDVQVAIDPAAPRPWTPRL